MRQSQNIPLSRFPTDVLSLLVLPVSLVLYVIASSLPRFWRGASFSVIGLTFVVFAVRLVRRGRALHFIWASIYLLLGLGMFYIALC
jgi:hypothetical protein